MADHAGERYLRLLVEQILATGGRDGEGRATLENAGAALVAVGAIEAGIVDALRTDLGLGLALRRPSADPAQLAAAVPPAGRRPPAVVATDGPVPRAVATAANHFETPDGVLVVESVSFGPDGATIVEALDTTGGVLSSGGGVAPGANDGAATSGEPDAKRRSRRGPSWPVTGGDPLRPAAWRRQRDRSEAGVEHRLGGPAPRTTGPGVPPRSRPSGPGREQLRITDDRGVDYRRGPATMGGGPGGWRWVSSLQPVPDPTTTWLEVALGDASHRLSVTAAGGVARGRPQRRSPGASWLLGALQDTVAHALRGATTPHTDIVADGVDALLALGRLTPFDGLLRQLTLLDAYPEGAAELDPSLGSALAGRDRRAGDRVAILPVATAVDLDGHGARIDVATLGPTGLRLSGRFSPWSLDGAPDDTAGWHITGFDDRHNHYVATVDQHNRIPAQPGAYVVWQLWPALDPQARSLRLRVAGPSLEASVELVVE